MCLSVGMFVVCAYIKDKFKFHFRNSQCFLNIYDYLMVVF